MLRIRTVSNADGLYGAYDPSTALTVRSAEVLGMTELSSRSQTKRHDELWTLPINRAALFLSLEDTFSHYDQTHHHFGQSWRWGLQSCQTQRTDRR